MSTQLIHPTAIVEKGVELDTSVKIGPYSVLKGKVQVGAGSVIESHVVIGSDFGSVKIGKNNHIYSGAMVGGPPQDLKYKNEPTGLELGDNNQIREFVTLNIGTATGTGVTRIGSNCLLMAYVHVAHDCQFGSHIAVANTSNFAGHVTVEDYVRVGGVCSFNQFIRIGKYSFIAGDSAVNKDVMPFTIAQGKYAVSRAPNLVLLERSGFHKDEIDNIYKAIRIVTKGNRTIEEALADIDKECASSENIKYLTEFIRKSERGIAR